MIVEKIKRLAAEKKAVILAHYYQEAAIQDIADYVGDSLALARWAASTDAEVIVLCGVHFMAETAKILSPEKRVFLPDLAAGCSLADSCEPEAFAAFVKEHPDHTVISYVNTSAAIKTMTDVVVTSSNARQIVDSFPPDARLIFAPDRNLGNYINSVTGRKMVLWEGACHVHERFSLEKILALKGDFPNALVLAHPECKGVILKIADYIGSTSALLNYATKSENQEFIVATESGILHEMQEKNPDKRFIPAPPNDSTCACNECSFMKLNTLEKLYDCLKNETPEVFLDAATITAAAKPILRMLELSNKLGL
ncbi:quinolinate synthase A [Bacteroidia bacterium]|nr:quinolinate synthase A [Bacteroidia bacterium]